MENVWRHVGLIKFTTSGGRIPKSWSRTCASGELFHYTLSLFFVREWNRLYSQRKLKQKMCKNVNFFDFNFFSEKIFKNKIKKKMMKFERNEQKFFFLFSLPLKLWSLGNEFHSSNQSFFLSFFAPPFLSPTRVCALHKYKRKHNFQYNVHMPTVNTLQTKLYSRKSSPKPKKKNSISIISFLIFNRAHKENFISVDIFVNIRTAILIINYSCSYIQNYLLFK